MTTPASTTTTHLVLRITFQYLQLRIDGREEMKSHVFHSILAYNDGTIGGDNKQGDNKSIKMME